MTYFPPNFKFLLISILLDQCFDFSKFIQNRKNRPNFRGGGGGPQPEEVSQLFAIPIRGGRGGVGPIWDKVPKYVFFLKASLTFPYIERSVDPEDPCSCRNPRPQGHRFALGDAVTLRGCLVLYTYDLRH